MNQIRSGLALALLGGVVALVGVATSDALVWLGGVAAVFGAVYVVYGLLDG